MLLENDLSTARVAAQAAASQERLLQAIRDSELGRAELLNPPGEGPHARFLAFRDSRAQHWCTQLMADDIVTDVRGDVLRIGFALYQDEADVDRLAARAVRLD